MDQYPTEEEEFEMMYQDEMELMNEMHEVNIERVNIVNPLPSTSKSIKEVTHPSNVRDVDESILQSPAVSQIPFTETQEHSHQPINRRLFDTPGGEGESGQPKRISSTPLDKNNVLNGLKQIQNNVVAGGTDCFKELRMIGINRKRRLEDLFGDIRDIDDDDDFYIDKEAKKQKGEEERDIEMIEKILNARRLLREVHNPLKKDDIEQLNALHDFKKRNLSYTIPKYPFIPLVRSDGERIYVRFHSEQFETKQIDDINFVKQMNGSLLGESKDDIWNQARELTLKRMTNQDTVATPANVVHSPNDHNLGEGILWVEKYKPKKYIDLLSDESTNRSLLSWLKMWDKIVFGKEFKTKEAKPGQMNTFNKKTKKFESSGGWNRRLKQTLNTDRDEHGRPIQKIALLCGPPGLGKTTLAHIIARHAGYSVREMNASDDRNPDAFRLTLENGTQMSSVLNEDKRPNCIVLDEIDGAPQQSIDFLIRFVTDNVTTKAKKGNKVQKNILRRPIICICNDMYVPALRQLRQIALVVNFPPIESARLAERLLEISRKERLRTDMSTLLTLAEKSGNDIRSCISIMQFYNSKKKKITLEDILNSNVGQKDRHRGLFGVWTSIFQIQRPQKQIVESVNPNTNEQQNFVTMTDTSISTRVKNILEIIHAEGDYERLMQGVFENYLSQKMPDPNLNGIVEATQWFTFSDQIHNMINHLQNYSIYSYLQYSFAIWHLLFASLAWPKINFPNRGYEFHQKTTTQRMIFQAFRRGITSGSIGIGQGHVILMETVPILKRILSPCLRSVSLQLLSPKERSDLVHTVNVMVDLGLAFIQIKSIDGTYQYQMEPDLDLLCQFPGFRGVTLSYFGRQLIAREIELEQMRRSAPKISKKKPENVQQKTTNVAAIKSVEGKTTPKNNSKQTVTEISPENNLPNHLRSLKPKTIRHGNFKEMVSKDFFGRITTKQAALTVQEGGTDLIVKSPIWYRYKEGFNNAVRKDVLMTDLL